MAATAVVVTTVVDVRFSCVTGNNCGNLGTSWAGQDAQNKPISLCCVHFFEVGREILTRALDQVHQNSTWRTKKKKKIHWLFIKFMILEKFWPAISYVGLFFFEFAKYCFGELDPNHVSKFQVLTSKIERCMAKFPPKGLCIQIYIYFRDSSITFERKWPMKWNAYVPTPRPKMYMPSKIEQIPSTLYFEQF